MFGLQAEIELPQQHTSTFLSDGDPIPSHTPLGMALQHRGHLLHDLEVQAKETLEARPLDLEDHLPATAEAGAMHLGQARRSEGLLFDVDDLGTALTELLLQQRLGRVKGEGRDAVLKAGEFRDPAGGQHIRPGREQLTQLDEGRPQREQLGRQPAGTPPLPPLLPLLGDTAGITPGLGVPPKNEQELKNGRPDPQGAKRARQCRSKAAHQAGSSRRRAKRVTWARS